MIWQRNERTGKAISESGKTGVADILLSLLGQATEGED